MKSLLIALLLGMICLFSFNSGLAQDPMKPVPISQLRDSPFTAGPFKITFTGFRDWLLSANIENTSDDFATFDPQYLSVIDNDKNQSDVLGVYTNSGPYVVTAAIRRIGPKATIKARYILTENVHFPVRIYYRDGLLGTVSK